MTPPSGALIMAGGRSERMRKRGDPTHKALVRLNGVTLIERCLATVLNHGFRSISVSLNVAETELIDFVQTRLSAEAAAAGAEVACLIEHEPLGTIGAAGRVVVGGDALLVVNADNVTDIDFTMLLAEHRRSAAAMTIACHRESVQVPFGELVVEDGSVLAYREKPAHTFIASSGTYVLSARAAACIAPNERVSIPELYERVCARSLRVTAYRHEAAWIDVNDEADLDRAGRIAFRELARSERSSARA